MCTVYAQIFLLLQSLTLILINPAHYGPVTYNQVHTLTLQPIHWACINSAIASTQSSVCAGGNDTHAHTGKGDSENL